MRSFSGRFGDVIPRESAPHPVGTEAGSAKCIVFSIWVAVAPFAPPYVIASAMLIEAGENVALPALFADILCQRSKANVLLAFASGFVTESGGIGAGGGSGSVFGVTLEGLATDVEVEGAFCGSGPGLVVFSHPAARSARAARTREDRIARDPIRDHAG